MQVTNDKAEIPNYKTETKTKTKKNKKDLYTQTPVRKLGFLDEFGEALRPVLSTSSKGFVHQLPNFAYIPATLYIMADVADKYKKGLDGTGEKPSMKMAAREAAYQGIVSIAAPIAIVRGTNKAMGCIIEKGKDKIPNMLKNTVSKASKASMDNKIANKVISKAGMPGKIAAAAVSIITLSKLSKPVDKIVTKFFEKVVDPKIGIEKND